ncbi:hypothetical protein NQ314_009415 [Rhamnusium bicolor]|uniref:Uncharacterized protein n=1 Tax=Rhamnusium bicolor TaxID=1586634 RepID=A0AAV8Y1C9_9CUCU|nr:hypothetical protein NQ314_009415 [Rhamnusium bicolor]
MDEIETIQPFVFLSHDDLKNTRLSCNNPLINNFDLSAWIERDNDHVDNKIDFTFKRESVDEFSQDDISLNSEKTKRRIKRAKTRTTTVKPRTTTKSKTNKKRATTSPLKIKITNVTTSTVKIENKYGGSGVTVDSIPPRPTFNGYRPQTYYSNHDQSDVTYLIGNVPTKASSLPTKHTDKPLEVNIKIQYYLQTTKKTTTTRKKKKKPTSKPTDSYEQDNSVVITQRPSTKKPELGYPVFMQSQGYDNVVVRPNDLFEKPTSRPRPTNSYSDNNRPTYIHSRPTNEDDNAYGGFRPSSNNYDEANIYSNNRPSSNGYSNVYSQPIGVNSDFYSYSDRTTTKRPYIIRPQTYYDTTIQNTYDDTNFEDRPFSSSQRPYVYRPESNHYVYTDDYTRRPTFKPQQSSYDDEISNNFYNYNKRPTVQNTYNKNDPINEVYAYLLDGEDRVDYIPKKPTFGQVDIGGPITTPTTGLVNDKISKPSKIYAIGHVHKLDNDQISDKLDFKTRHVTKRKGVSGDDRRFVKISSVKAEAIINDENGIFYSVQRRDGDDDLVEVAGVKNGDEDKIQVVQIDVSPSEVK